ncbi:DnaJ and TPR domain-containing protein [Protomyces lactucae-debilis]|uniref:DnaJ and TPR domain-containing protein n=1 Tax=Protomyces lactucae-debilis TaxID=2754530 RepID=A0A1Y2FKE6_PROLT|nr:DnaJ and TPR domain-containing protein [Protomyces lactucae-debilis]ORY84430.1 DnaJ and TPR domain-containing protein [Protomyces lactucae-debilis]
MHLSWLNALFLALLANPSALIAAQGDEPVQATLDKADSLLARGKTADALTVYTAAIDKDPQNYLTYFKRATAYLALNRHSAALGDFAKVLQVKPGFKSALTQVAKVKASLGQWDAAADAFAKVEGDVAKTMLASLKDAKRAAEEAEVLRKKGDAAGCLVAVEKAIDVASASSQLRYLKAQCSVMAGHLEEAIADLVFAGKVNPSDAQVQLLSSALFMFALNDPGRAIQQLKACLHYDPDAKACKKSFRQFKALQKQVDALDKAIAAGSWITAKKLIKGTAEKQGVLAATDEQVAQLTTEGLLSAALKMDLPLAIKERACEAFTETKEATAMEHCDAVLAQHDTSLTALRCKAELLLRAENYDGAIDLLNKANEHGGREDDKVQQAMQKAQKLLRQSKQKDYYKVLEVPRDATKKEIKKAYRRLSKIWHPDKYHGDLSKAEQTKKIEAINEAYEVLTDDGLRQRFDNGDDPNAPPDQGHNPFAHHGGGSPFGQPFFFQQGGGGGGNPFGGQHFSFQF